MPVGYTLLVNIYLSWQETLKENYLNDVKPMIKQFAEFLGEKKFITGDKVNK